MSNICSASNRVLFMDLVGIVLAVLELYISGLVVFH